MGNIIIIGILVIAAAFALSSTIKHFKGQGGCCGGGGNVKEHKKLNAPKIGEKCILIEGMHCENCQNRVEHAKAWIIPDTEDLRPYITKNQLVFKWGFTLVGNPLMAATLAGIMLIFIR